MKVFDTSNLSEQVMKSLSADEAAHIYNGLDVCVTAEVYNELMNQLEKEPQNIRDTYDIALSKLAPIMEMSMRGILIDETARQKTIKELEIELWNLDKKFQRIMKEVFDGELNWRSPTQLKNLFYGMLGLKEIKKRNAKGQFTATVNREALEYFNVYLYARPLAKMILVMRDLHKQLGFLKTEVDKDQRIRTNYNPAGTNTGRLASSRSEFGTGTNLQNVNRKLRYPFIADKGMYMFNVDLEQADGRNVGAICWEMFYDITAEEIYDLIGEDPRVQSHVKDKKWIGPVGQDFAGAYLDACESGDLHTSVCVMTWPELDWSEDKAGWKEFCDGLIAHGQDSYRQLSKKLGHGTNYYGTPRTMAKHAHTPRTVIEDFQKRYFTQFPCILAWHASVIRMIKETGTVTTLFGRRRMFFGRGNDASTHRKAIAYAPQSMTGEQIDRGLLAVWRKYPEVQLLNQVHDSILFQPPFREAENLIPKILFTMKVELTLKGGRKFYVPLDAAGGWNWGYYDKDKPSVNPHGLKKWKGHEDRNRPSPKARLKDYL